MTAEGIGLTDRTALELLDVLDRREASALEVVDAHIARIEAVDRVLNAIPTRTFERARDEARASDARRARREPLGPLEGLPVAFKDLQPTAGVRTTMGSRVLAEWIPEEDSLTVRRIREAGAIGLGKTNVPEFGAGSQTYNDVFGPTRNPWDPSRTPGGSSGGAAAALAARMLALADGSDYGGSLRNPASFCDVVGFRTTPGLIPDDEPSDGLSLAVDGPMARTVRDVALLLSVMAAPVTFEIPDDVDVRGRRIAIAPRFAGLPMEPDVTAEVEAAGARLERLGCIVEVAEPDMREARLAFLAPRHASFRRSILERVGDRVDELKPELRWHVEEGAKVTPEDLAAAAAAKRRLGDGFRRFMDRFDALVLPVSQVLPFPIELTWPREIEGVPMPDYVEWMRSCWAVSLLDAPALAVPSGFRGPEGRLPVGIQLVGRLGAEQAILELGAAYELAAGEPLAQRALCSPLVIDRPTKLDLFYDFHCPYCYRAVDWIGGLGQDVVDAEYRLFALEQVNRDPGADGWRLWEQPLDYRHYRDRQDRRPLAPFLAMTHVEAVESADVAARYRLGVFALRFDEHEDITDIGRLAHALTEAGGDGHRLKERFDDAAADVAARVRIATDWEDARRDFLVFGVPTLRLEGVTRPYYLRLEQRLTPADGRAFWDRFVGLLVEAPYLLEIKGAERDTQD